VIFQNQGIQQKIVSQNKQIGQNSVI